MSTQTLAIPHTPAIFKKPSSWNLWRRPRIVAVNASELIESRTAPLCNGRWTGTEAHVTAQGRRYLALTARWKDAAIAGAVLEIRGRQAVVRMLHVEEAWRRSRVGRRLLRRLLGQASFQFISDVYVVARAADAGFYALHGFRPLEENASNRFDLADWNEPITDDGERLVMHRRLTSPFVSVPYDGIMVKMG